MGTSIPKAAVIGVGYLGQFHAEKYSKSGKCELAAVVDVAQDNAERCAKKLRVQALRDYRNLRELGVECVSIASDTKSHHEIALWCLGHGIDVLVEKPMTVTLEQARELVESAHANGRVLQVGHLERFNPAFLAVHSVLKAPRFFEVRRIAPFARRGHDVDVVLDLMIHDIDIVAHLVNRPIVSVEAVGIPVLTGTIDIANARLRFEGGAVANVTASRAAFVSERTIRIFQPDLYVSLDYGKKKLKICRKTGERDLFGFPKIDVEEHKVEERDALADEIDHFLDCVQSRNTPWVSGEEGMRALELAYQIEEALKASGSQLETAGI